MATKNTQHGKSLKKKKKSKGNVKYVWNNILRVNIHGKSLAKCMYFTAICNHNDKKYNCCKVIHCQHRIMVNLNDVLLNTNEMQCFPQLFVC